MPPKKIWQCPYNDGSTYTRKENLHLHLIKVHLLSDECAMEVIRTGTIPKKQVLLLKQQTTTATTTTATQNVRPLTLDPEDYLKDYQERPIKITLSTDENEIVEILIQLSGHYYRLDEGWKNPIVKMIENHRDAEKMTYNKWIGSP